MSGAIPPLPNTLPCRGAQLKHRDNFNFYLCCVCVCVCVCVCARARITSSNNESRVNATFISTKMKKKKNFIPGREFACTYWLLPSDHHEYLYFSKS
jgi:hypothetical protein